MLHGRATALHAAGRLAEAEAAYRTLLRSHPGHAQAHCDLGVLLRQSRRPEEAIALHRRAVALDPGNAQAWNHLGDVLQGASRLEESRAAYERALALQPALAETWNNLGIVLQVMGQIADAQAALERAVQLRPDEARYRNNRGMVFAETGQWARAEADYREAVRLDARDADAWTNLGILLQATGRLDEAETPLRNALAAQPDHAEAQLSWGLLLLAQGRYEQGWPLYQARHRLADGPAQSPPPGIPPWAGDALAGRSIALWCEQGFGDSLQFVRYAALLKARGAGRITLLCPRPLEPLLATAEGVDATLSGGRLPPHDLWCHLLDLPLHLGTTLQTIPARLPYLKAEPQAVRHWQDRLGTTGLRVGLAWKGSATNRNGAHRALASLAELAPLWRVPGITFVSLQKGRGEDEARDPPPGQPLVDAGSGLEDFAQTAAVVRALDLVITVDTAVAHLAGALAVPTWVLLAAHGADWRWLQDREDSPWYPGVMRLFRQRDAGDWTAVVERVATALRAWADDTR
jgi:tetratricopeptide (TPR) repeat protein